MSAYRITFSWHRMPRGREYLKTYTVLAENDKEARELAEDRFLERHPGRVQGLIVEVRGIETEAELIDSLEQADDRG